MRTNAKADAEVKIQTAKLCLGGKMSQGDAARQAGVSKAVVQGKYKPQSFALVEK